MGQRTVCVPDHDRASDRPATPHRDLVRRAGWASVPAFRRPRAVGLGAQYLQANAHVTVELGDETHAGVARVLQPGTVEDQRARELLVGKYREGDNLDEWGRTALPVVIEFSADDEPSSDPGSSSRRCHSSQK